MNITSDRNLDEQNGRQLFRNNIVMKIANFNSLEEETRNLPARLFLKEVSSDLKDEPLYSVDEFFSGP